jgi:hypothetical protein
MVEDERSSLAKWTLSGEDITINIQHILKGEIIVPYERTEKLPDGTVYKVTDVRWQQKAKPMLSQEGIQQITTMLYGFLNRNVFLSNLTEKRAMSLARDILLMANKKLFLDAERFGLTPSNYALIITELESHIIPALLRAFEEGERKFLSKTTTELRQIVGSDKQQQGSNIFGWGGGGQQ